MVFLNSANADVRQLMEDKNVSFAEIAKEYRLPELDIRIALEKELPTSSKADIKEKIEKIGFKKLSKEIEKERVRIANELYAQQRKAQKKETLPEDAHGC